MKFCKLYVLTGIIVVILFSCKRESISPGSPSFNYFPTEKGTYIVYDVDSVLHGENDNNTDDSVYQWHFQIKEKIDATFYDGQGRLNQVIRRYRRDFDTLAWNEINIWTQVLTSSAAYRTEENIAYHKLSFPINDHAWDGNDANTQEQEMYTYENFHVASTVNGLGFDSTLSVLQRNENNFVQKIYSKEIYANHVGMIYKERDHLSKINGQVVKGTEFKMTVAGYGSE